MAIWITTEVGSLLFSSFSSRKGAFCVHLIFLVICMICASYAFQLKENEQITQGIVAEFSKLAGVPISTSWNPSVTHVIASTDLSGACKRTLKFLMAILHGKWVVSLDCKSALLFMGNIIISVQNNLYWSICCPLLLNTEFIS